MTSSANEEAQRRRTMTADLIMLTIGLAGAILIVHLLGWI